MRRVIDEFDARVLIGEIYLPLERLVAYYGRDLRARICRSTSRCCRRHGTREQIEKIIFEYEHVLPTGAWPNWVLGNHDRPRVASRVGQARAHVAAMLLLSLRGTPTLYYGDEIGMHQAAIAPDQVRDPLRRTSRASASAVDGCRTPMQWNGDAQRGLLDIAAVAAGSGRFFPRQRGQSRCGLPIDPQPLQALIGLRKKLPQLVSGAYVPMAAEGDLLLYRRESEGRAVVVALNLGAEPVSIASDALRAGGEILLSTFLDRQAEKIQGSLDLRGNEGVIIGV